MFAGRKLWHDSGDYFDDEDQIVQTVYTTITQECLLVITAAEYNRPKTGATHVEEIMESK